MTNPDRASCRSDRWACLPPTLAALLSLPAIACIGTSAPPPAPAPPPLGMVLVEDGRAYAGVASVDITPTLGETYSDLNEDSHFDGCFDQPAGGTEACPEPYDDANGNGWFDPVFIGGFGPLRPAASVHDPITARALVLAQDGSYVVLVSLDLVGLGSPRIHAARDVLASEGLDPDRLLVASTHNHQGPDTMGLWGDPYDFSDPISGLDLAYQEQLSVHIAAVVRAAAGSMEAVELRLGRLHMRDRDPYLTGTAFGGRNPTAKLHGMVHDIRDPVLVSDQLLAMQGTRADGTTLFTWTNWSGHPEVFGSTNTGLSSDWVGVTRTVLEERYGGLAIHMPECLGGMQSALGADLPLVEEDGTHRFQLCTEDAVADPADLSCAGRAAGDPRLDEHGDPIPEWAPRGTWPYVVSHGWHIAEAAVDALEAGVAMDLDPLEVEVESFYAPLENLAYNILGPSGIFDLGLEDAVTDRTLCPELGGDVLGCLETRTWRLRLGPLGLVTAPGELLPELAWGLPEGDPRWTEEAAAPTPRGPGSLYFPQHDPACNEVDWEDCRTREVFAGCDCLRAHAWPYRLSYDPSVPPLLDLLDTDYRAVLGMVDNYLSYVIPEPDFNTRVSLLGEDGDHYEDTVSPSSVFANKLQDAQLRIHARLTEE